MWSMQEVIDLGMPQWLSLTDAETLIARHVTAEMKKEETAMQNGLAEENLMANELCKVPNMVAPDNDSATPDMELELDLDCWKVTQL